MVQVGRLSPGVLARLQAAMPVAPSATLVGMDIDITYPRRFTTGRTRLRGDFRAATLDRFPAGRVNKFELRSEDGSVIARFVSESEAEQFLDEHLWREVAQREVHP